MSLYRVRVDCWKAGKRKNACVTRHFIVEAETIRLAHEKAVLHAESTATFGEDWIGFEFREAASVKLPLEI